MNTFNAIFVVAAVLSAVINPGGGPETEKKVKYF